jgi:two-component system, NtrC family, response regulator PilR
VAEPYFEAMAAPDRILIVDDDPDMRMLLEGVLRAEGFDTVCAESAPRALQLLEQKPFDLVLTDKRMAGGDGHALVDEISKRHPTVGAAMMTGYRGHDPSVGGKVLAYFEKPIYDLRAVADTLKTVLQEHRKKLGLLSG